MVTRPSVAAKHVVVVGVEPTDATIARDGVSLGSQPVVLHLSEGETANLAISRDGFLPPQVTVDGTTPRQMVRLTAAVAPRPTVKPPAPVARPAAPPTDPEDPWTRTHK